MKWFRFYSDAMRNPKVASLSDREFRLWVSLLSVASENDGHIPALSDLKHVLRTRLDHLSTGVDRLITTGLIDRSGELYTPHNWDKFQYKSDTSTPRVTLHRAKKVTPPDTEQIQIQTQIEPKGSKGRGSRLPTDWMPDEQIATDLGLTHSQAKAELAKFRDYWAAKAGRDAAKLDWPATWRNWVRTAMERMPRAGPGGKPRTASDVLMNLSNEMKAAENVQQPSRSDFVPPRQLPRIPQRPSDGGEGLFDGDPGPDGYRRFQDR